MSGIRNTAAEASSDARNRAIATPPQENDRPVYWLVIALLLLALSFLYLYHLATGYTPSRAAISFNIAGFELDIYWYGILIVTGIGLGCWVAADLARRRAEALFVNTVPAPLRFLPLADSLAVDDDVIEALSRRNMATVGDVLYAWGMDPRNLGLSKEETAAVESALLAVPGIEAVWLTAAPWGIWNPDHVWNGIIWALIFGVIGARLYHVLTPSPSMAC